MWASTATMNSAGGRRSGSGRGTAGTRRRPDEVCRRHRPLAGSPSIAGRSRSPTRSWRRRNGAASGSRWRSPITAGIRSSRTGCRTRPRPPCPWPRPWRPPPNVPVPQPRPGRALSRRRVRPARGGTPGPDPGGPRDTRRGDGRSWPGLVWAGGIPVHATRSPRPCWLPGDGASPDAVCVVGCGAIGSLFAAHLAAAGEVEVWVFDVSEVQVRAINDGGLQCTGTGGPGWWRGADRHGLARGWWRGAGRRGPGDSGPLGRGSDPALPVRHRGHQVAAHGRGPGCHRERVR